MDTGKLIVISGPSGVGKGTLVKKLLKADESFALSISSTTRTKREGEVHGREYYFLSREEFENKIKNNQFAEYAEYAGNYYGTDYTVIKSMLSLGRNLILEIDVQGAMQIKEKFPNAKLIFILPPNLAELKKRLTNRHTENEETIKLRLAQVDREISKSNSFDVKIVNDDIELATLAILEAVYS